MDAANKRIALLIEQGFGARILLQTDILETLINSNLNPIILTSGPEAIGNYLKDTKFSKIPIHHLNIEKNKTLKLNTLIRLLSFIRLFSLKTRTVKDLFKMELSDSKASRNINNKLFMILVRFFVYISKINYRLIFLFIRIENRIALRNSNELFFSKYKPDVLLTTSIGTFDNDANLIREAKSRGVKVISYILSWDNSTVRGFGINLTDDIITWSDTMKKELTTLHHLPENKIHVGGVPHYDTYARPDALWSKHELFHNMKIPVTKNVILLGTKSPNAYKSNMQVAEIICDLISSEESLKDYILVVRLHPLYFRSSGNGSNLISEDWNSLVEKFGSEVINMDYPQIIGNDLRYFMPQEEIAKLGSLLKHSKVVVNMFSTLNIESSIFDIPTINVCFQDDSMKSNDYKQARFNIVADSIQTHNQRVIQYDATVIAYEKHQLLELLKASLSHPEQKKQGRAKLVNSECGENLGESGVYIGKLISKLSYSV